MVHGQRVPGTLVQPDDLLREAVPRWLRGSRHLGQQTTTTGGSQAPKAEACCVPRDQGGVCQHARGSCSYMWKYTSKDAHE